METPRTADAVVCGAGIAGVVTAYFLAVRHGLRDVVVCDPRPPLTLTSDKSTECYRNWWPTRPMISLITRSIDLLEHFSDESDDVIHLGRRGYLFVTADTERIVELTGAAEETSILGGGPVRRHGDGSDFDYVQSAAEGWRGAPAGFDVFTSGESARAQFPYLSPHAVGAVHVRRAGWFSAQQLGAWMIERGRSAGLELVSSRVVGVTVDRGAVSGVELADGSRIGTPVFVNAGGPLIEEVGALVGVEVPVYSELHLKVSFKDTFGAVPRDAPMLIWSDPQKIDWSDEERRHLDAEGRGSLAGVLPSYCHGRPEGGADSPWVVALWEYGRDIRTPEWPIPTDPMYTELVVRGMATMVPRLGAYRDRLPESVVDGGYYTKTVENRPLVGPLGPEGSFVVGALSGFGVMAASAAGELGALHAIGGALPDYAPAFAPDRYEDADYLREIAEAAAGQL